MTRRIENTSSGRLRTVGRSSLTCKHRGCAEPGVPRSAPEAMGNPGSRWQQREDKRLPRSIGTWRVGGEDDLELERGDQLDCLGADGKTRRGWLVGGLYTDVEAAKFELIPYALGVRLKRANEFNQTHHGLVEGSGLASQF